METRERQAAVSAFLHERRSRMPRMGERFLTLLLQTPDLMERMRFCPPEERWQVRNSVLIMTADDCSCWSLLLDSPTGQDRASIRARSMIALKLLDLAPAEVVGRLGTRPIWFLAADGVPTENGEAGKLEETAYGLFASQQRPLRLDALRDQLDAALEARDWNACRRIHALLRAD